MSKIWVVQNVQKYSGGRKFRIFHTESELLRGIRDEDNLIVHEYDLISSRTASDFLKERERDTQVRSVLGELDPHEENAIRLIEMFDQLFQDQSSNSDIKERTLGTLNKLKSNKKSFTSYLIQNKNFFLKVSDSVEWILSILKCHNFQDCKIEKVIWNTVSRTHDRIDLSTEELRENFKLAKKELKKK